MLRRGEENYILVHKYLESINYFTIQWTNYFWKSCKNYKINMPYITQRKNTKTTVMIHKHVESINYLTIQWKNYLETVLNYNIKFPVLYREKKNTQKLHLYDSQTSRIY